MTWGGGAALGVAGSTAAVDLGLDGAEGGGRGTVLKGASTGWTGLALSWAQRASTLGLVIAGDAVAEKLRRGRKRVAEKRGRRRVDSVFL